MVVSEMQEANGPAVGYEQHGNNPTDLENQNESSHQDGFDQLAQVDPKIERRVVRKIDLNLMPLVMALCKHCI